MNLRADITKKIVLNRKVQPNRLLIFAFTLPVLVLAVLLYFRGEIAEIKKQMQHQYLNQEKQSSKIELAPIKPKTVTRQVIDEVAKKHPVKEQSQSKERQTDFNDNNYIPRGASNVIASFKSNALYANNQAQATPTQPKQQSRKFSSIRRANWAWESYGSGFSKKKKSGAFTYLETEKGINTSTVCGNYKYGSLDYRDCRKAAKKWFKDRCSSHFKQACLAGNMIP